MLGSQAGLPSLSVMTRRTPWQTPTQQEVFMKSIQVSRRNSLKVSGMAGAGLAQVWMIATTCSRLASRVYRA